MQTMDDALETLVQSGRITARDAYNKAVNKSKFEPLVGEA